MHVAKTKVKKKLLDALLGVYITAQPIIFGLFGLPVPFMQLHFNIADL